MAASGLVFAGVTVGVVALNSDPTESDAITTGDPSSDSSASATAPPTPSTARRLKLVRTVTGNIAPKSVVRRRPDS
jgi:hypothetical protein